MELSFDVVAVDLETNKVRFMGQSKTWNEADALMRIAIMRLGLDEEFFSVVPTGKYAAGDTWTDSGENKNPNPPDPGATIERIGGMSYPIGPRGLDRQGGERMGSVKFTPREVASVRGSTSIRLIAAAPELLESLKGVMEMVEDSTLVRDTSNDSDRGWSHQTSGLMMVLARATAAIAKAEGHE